MNPDKYLLYSTEEIVLDHDFLNWVLHPDRESDSIWKAFLDQHPEMKIQVQEAAFIVRSLQPMEPAGLDDRLGRVLESVIEANKARKQSLFLKVMKYAAGLLLLLGAGSMIYLMNRNLNRFPLTEADSGSLNKGRIILADGTSHEFDSDQTIIRQTGGGQVMVNNDTLEAIAIPSGSGRNAMNHIIIPYGKRSAITLADGTHIWLNSGSQISYPVAFKGDTREVYLSGEAYFDVNSDTKKPFIVVTRDIRIRVTGTSFNVSSYSADDYTQTVLVKGEVKIIQNTVLAKSMEMKPGERVIFRKSGESFSKDRVDVAMYSSWINGFLIFDNELTTEIFKKLERIYNQRIIADPGLSTITFSGKLDLQEDIKDVLDNIAFASGLNITRNGEYFIIKP